MIVFSEENLPPHTASSSTVCQLSLLGYFPALFKYQSQFCPEPIEEAHLLIWQPITYMRTVITCFYKWLHRWFFIGVAIIGRGARWRDLPWIWWCLSAWLLSGQRWWEKREVVLPGLGSRHIIPVLSSASCSIWDLCFTVTGRAGGSKSLRNAPRNSEMENEVLA